MKSIAFIFTHAPHGNIKGKEGLDMLLSCSLSFSKIGVFFMNDGVFQLMPDQNSNFILLNNYSNAFKILPLYGINNFFFVKIPHIKED